MAAQPGRARQARLMPILVAGGSRTSTCRSRTSRSRYIGKSFDASQTTFDLIAVGVLPGSRGVGALVRRARRSHAPQADDHPGTPLTIPACVVAVLRVGRRRPPRRAPGRRPRAAGMAYPTNPVARHCAWSLAMAHRVDRALVGARRRPVPAHIYLIGVLLEHFDWGSASSCVALLMAIKFVPAHINETTEPVDNIGGVIMVCAGRLADRRHQLPSGGERVGQCGGRAAGGPVCRSLAVRPARAALDRRARSTHLRIAARPTFWVAGVRGDHRLRLADGRGLHQPAVSCRTCSRTRRSRGGPRLSPPASRRRGSRPARRSSCRWRARA